MTPKTQKSSKIVIKESIYTLLFFIIIGIVLWITQDHIFFLFNFLYIGIAASLGELLFGLYPRHKKTIGRKISQLMIGAYMLFVLGLLGRENMQIEGFYFYLFAGIFSGPVIHYLIAKVFGTFLFGRGWCSWACWTTMVLDFFPWMKPEHARLKYWGILRYIHFIITIILVYILWHLGGMNDYHTNSILELNWLVIGNVIYYMIAIILAVLLKDNRAFCKYVCPIPVVMKAGAGFSIWKIEIDDSLCNDCGICESGCPMNIKLLSYKNNGQRILSTECIACQQCVNSCPSSAVSYTKGFDFSFKEYLDKV